MKWFDIVSELLRLANQKWIVADGGDDTIVLRNFQHAAW